MLAADLVHMNFIMLRYIALGLCSPEFYHKEIWILLKACSVSFEMIIWFLSLIPFIWLALKHSPNF